MKGNKVITVTGNSGKSLDLDSRVVDAFAGREAELRIYVDAHADFFTSEDSDPTDAMFVLAGVNVAHAELNARKGWKPRAALINEAEAYARQRVAEGASKNAAASDAARKYKTPSSTIRDRLKKTGVQ